MTADELETFVTEADWDWLFKDATARENQSIRRKSDDDLALYLPKIGLGKDSSHISGGAIAGQKIGYLFQRATSERVQVSDFDQLPIPFRAIATDIVTGDQIILGSGSLSTAMRASMSVPGAFDPVPYGDALLVDGGIVNQVPVDVVRAMGADVVIAVDVGSPKLPREKLTNVLAIVNQLTTLAIQDNTERQIASLCDHDILISPELGDTVGSADFDKIPESYPIGYAAAELHRARLSELAIPKVEFVRWRSGLESRIGPPGVIEWVRIENDSRFSDEVINNLVDIPIGEPLDQDKLLEDLGEIHALGFVRLATHHVMVENGRTGVVIEIEQDSRGTTYFESGIDLYMGNGGTSSFNLRAGVLKTDMDERGSEMRVLTQIGEDPGLLFEAYKIMDDNRRWLILPRLTYLQSDSRLFDESGNAILEFDQDAWSATFGIGREFGRHAILDAGMRRYGGDLSVRVGDPMIEGLSYDGGEWFVGGLYDRLNDRYIPSEGQFARFEYIKSEDSLGADAEFEQVFFQAVATNTWGKHNLLGGVRYSTTLDDNAPVYALAAGGGFLNLSGFEQNELLGQHFGVAVAGYRYLLDQGGLLPAWAGFTVEYGNATEDRDDIFGEGILNGSVYVAFDSPLGPIYLGYGKAEDRSGLLFLKMGALFGNASLSR
jgi:NTE family protein